MYHVSLHSMRVSGPSKIIYVSSDSRPRRAVIIHPGIINHLSDDVRVSAKASVPLLSNITG